MEKQEHPTFQHPQPQSNEPALGQIAGADPIETAQIAILQQSVADMQNKRVNLTEDIIGFFETVTAVPTGKPINFWQQVKFYSNATTYRLYIYDTSNNVWRYATLT